MRYLLCIPATLSAVILAAHFLRDGNLPAVGFCLAAPFLLAVRHRLAVWGVQGFLVWGAAVWLLSIGPLMQKYAAEERPPGKMIVILSSVAAFTLLSAAFLFWFPTSRGTTGTADAEAPK